MIEISKSQKATEKPIPSEVSAGGIDLLVYQPVRGVRFILQQMHDFYTVCASLNLPTSNPISFFYELNQQFTEKGRSAFTIEDTSIDPVEYRPLYLTLLLIYSCFGNFLFDSFHQQSFSLPVAVRKLIIIGDNDLLRQEIEACCLADSFRSILSSNAARKVFDLYPEFLHLEEMNCRFYALQTYMETLEPLKVNGIWFCPTKRTKALFELFLAYYMDNEGLPSEQQEYKGHSPIFLKKRLSLALELQQLHKRYCNLKHRTEAKSDSHKKCLLRAIIHQMIAILSFYSEEICDFKELNRFWQHYIHRGDIEYSESISFRMQSPNAYCCALIEYCSDIKLSKLSISVNVVRHLEKLLSCFDREPLYLFFLNIHKTLEVYPDLQPFAPAYVWMLFSRFRSPIYNAKQSMFKGRKTVDFSFKPLFNDYIHELLSEESTSKRHFTADCKLFAELAELFKTEVEPYEVDLPMCEHIFQLLTRTQMDAYSNTSIIGMRLNSQKPLFRGFSLIYEPMQHIADDLWKTMPRHSNTNINFAHAESFYQDNGRHAAKVMKYLLERTGGKPDSRKKTLTVEQCEEIISITLLSPPGAQTLEVQDSARKFYQWMKSYTENDTNLRDFASQSNQNFELLQFAVYRIALERYAHHLTRKVLEHCSQIFYLPIIDQEIAKMWETFFRENRDTIAARSLTDKGCIRNMCLTSRLFTTTDTSTMRSKTSFALLYHEIDRLPPEIGAVIVRSGNPSLHREYLSQKRRTCILFEADFVSDDSKSYRNDLIRQYKLAVDTGFDGVLLDIPDGDLLMYLLTSKQIDTLDDQGILALMQTAAPLRYFCSDLRELIGPEIPIILRITASDYHFPLLSDALRVLCRWLYDDGIADALQVSLKEVEPERSSTSRLSHALHLAAKLGSSLPIPVIYSIPNHVSADLKAILKRHPVWGFCFDMSAISL